MTKGRRSGGENRRLLEILRRTAEGDAQAMEQLFAWLIPLMQGHVKRLSGFPAQERDEMVAQACFWFARDLPRSCKNYRIELGTPRAYFTRIIHRKLARYLRDSRAQHRLPVSPEATHFDIDDQSQDVSNGEREAAAAAMEDAIYQWIAGRSDPDQYIFCHRIMGTAQSSEVAEVLHMSPQNIDTRVSRLRGDLTAFLTRAGWLAVAVAIGIRQLLLMVSLTALHRREAR